MYGYPRPLPLDRVKTKSGRHGHVVSVRNNDTAVVRWDDGEEFPIRYIHLEVLAHDCVLPPSVRRARS